MSYELIEINDLSARTELSSNDLYVIQKGSVEQKVKEGNIGSLRTTRTVTGTTSQLVTDMVILCNTAGGDITINLLAGIETRNLKIIKIADANKVVINPFNTETIEGELNLDIEGDSGAYIEIQYLNEDWKVVNSSGLYVGKDKVIDEDKNADFASVSVGGQNVLDLILPIGTVKNFYKPSSVPNIFAEANGQLIDDSASPYHEKRLPNLNGADVVLTITFTADPSGSFATISTNDVDAIGLHDWVTGSGIEDHSYVKSIDYSTGEIIISDIDASGEIVCTFTNEGRGIVGGSAFGSVGDKMQRIEGKWGEIGIGSDTAWDWFSNGAIRKGSSHSNGRSNATSGDGFYITFNSANSPNARATEETWGKTKTDNYIMKAYIRIK